MYNTFTGWLEDSHNTPSSLRSLLAKPHPTHSNLVRGILSDMLLYITPIGYRERGFDFLLYLRVPQREQSCLSRLESRLALTLATTLALA